MPDWGLLALLGLLLALSAFFSASESALFSLGRLRLREMEERHAVLGAKVRTLLRDPQHLLLTILLGNTLVNVAFCSLATAWILEHAAGQGLARELLSGLAVLGVVLVFGEAVPKAVGVARPEILALSVVAPLSVLNALLRPVLAPLAIGRGKAPEASRMTQEDLSGILDLAASQGALGQEEASMAKAALQLGRRRVKEIMVPRVEMVSFLLGRPRAELEALFLSTRHSRLVAAGPTVDHVQGVIEVREFLSDPLADPASLVRPVRFVPEQMSVERLLREFQERRETHAVVVDEHGGTAGFVALEDAVEAVVGDILDEGEVAPAIERGEDGSVRVPGALPIRRWNEVLSPKIPEGEGYDTLGGFLLDRFGSIPPVWASVAYADAVFTVLQTRRGRILEVRVSGAHG